MDTTKHEVSLGNLWEHIPEPFALGLNLKFWVGPKEPAFIDIPGNAEMGIHRST